jgi:AbrB family looped-hinge helix DNA binding protein
MTSTSVLSENGQVTLPEAIREHLGLEPLDQIGFEITEDGIVRLRKANPTLEKFVGNFPALGLSDAELKSLTREAKDEHYATKYRR